MRPGQRKSAANRGSEPEAESLQLVGKYYLGGLVFLFGSLYTERNRNTNSRRK